MYTAVPVGASYRAVNLLPVLIDPVLVVHRHPRRRPAPPLSCPAAPAVSAEPETPLLPSLSTTSA